MANNPKTNETPRTVAQLEALLAEKEMQLAAMQQAVAHTQPAADAQASAPASAYREDTQQLKRRVTVRLPVTGSNKEPLFVRFGDETFTIKRGVDVSIPYYVWLHLQECQQADDALTLRMNDLTGSFTNGMELYRL